MPQAFFLIAANRIVICLFLFIGLLNTKLIHAAEYEYLNFSNEDGLPNSIINAIAEDSLGFMWFGTTDGICRFDGYEFETFRHVTTDPNTISHNVINDIAVDQSGDLWVSTRNGLNHYSVNQDIWTRIFFDTTLNPSCSQNHTGKLFVDSQQNLWISVINGLIKLNTKNKKYRHISFPFKTKNNDCHHLVNDFIESDKNTIYIACGKEGIYKTRHGKTFEKIKIPPFHKDYSILRLAMHHDTLIVGTNRGILALNRKEKLLNINRQYTKIKGIESHMRIWDMQVIKNKVWFLTGNKRIGHYLPSTNKTELLSPSNSNIQNYSFEFIKTIFCDTRNNIWLGTQEAGILLQKSNTKAFTKINTNPNSPLQLPENNVASIFVDKENALWIGTWGKGLVNYKHGKPSIIFSEEKAKSTPDRIISGQIGDICEDVEGNIWFITWNGGLAKISNKTKDITTFIGGGNDLSGWAFRSLHIDKKNRIYLGSINNGVERFNPTTGERKLFVRNEKETKNSIIDNKILCFYPSPIDSSILWIGTGNGLSAFNKVTEEFRNYSFLKNNVNNFNFNSIMHLYQAGKNIIWVATEGGGIHKVNIETGRFINYGERHGLVNNNIYAIYPDSDNNVWLSTKNGISRFNPQKVQFHNFNTEDGLSGNEFKWGAHFKDQNGKIYFGGVNGITAFHPDKIILNKKTPTIVFKQLLINNRLVSPHQSINGQIILDSTISLTKNIELKYKNNSITLEFTGISYDNARKNRYAYKLEGFEEKWHYTDATNSRATYTNLREGDYLFRVSAANNDGVWNENPVNMNIHVDPPFFRTRIAQFIYLLFFILLYYLSSRIIKSREKLKYQVSLEKMRRKKDHELNESRIQFFTNLSHEFKTPLNLIISPLEKLLKQKNNNDDLMLYSMMHRNASRLLKLIEQLMDFRKIKSSKMEFRPFYGDIIKFLKQIAQDFEFLAKDKNIKYLFHSNEKSFHMMFDPDLLEKAFSNLISNAFKFTPDHGSIMVDADVISNNDISVKIIDSGMGIRKEKQEDIFDQFYRDIFTGSISGTGIGLTLTREFIKMHEGEITVSSKPGEGSVFTIVLPVKNYKDNKVPNLNMDEFLKTSKTLISTSNGKKHSLKKDLFPLSSDNSSKPTLILIEDDEEMVRFLKPLLEDRYNLYSHNNGTDIFKKINKTQPDIVLSDIKMPFASGIDLCKRIKSNPGTKHIPVILFSSYNTTDYQEKSLHAGADAFISKPFHMDVLIAHINSLILNRRQIRQKFDNNYSGSSAVMDEKHKFTEKLRNVILSNLNNKELGVEYLLLYFDEGRTNFYKKVKLYTSYSVSDYIQRVRLEEANRMLCQNNKTIQEISSEIGFKDSSYFSKIFKKVYGYPPSKVKRNT